MKKICYNENNLIIFAELLNILFTELKKNMKTIITAKDSDIMAEFDLRFGRGAFFCIYDSESKKTKFIKNEFAEAQGGAGTKTAEKMVELGISKVVSGDFGPKAKSLLNEFKIEMEVYQDDSKTIKDIIEILYK